MPQPAGRSDAAPSRLARALALARWQRAAGAYWPYVCAAPLIGAALPRVPAGHPRVPQVIRGVLSDVRDGRAAIFVDVPPARSLPSTEELRKAGFWVVPIIQRWAAERAVLPCERLVADLMAYAPPSPWPADSRGVVFLLDGGRAGSRQVWGQTLTTHEEPTRGRFDNRYSYPACRFPPPIFLQAMGVTRVDWISTSGIAPDLAWYAESLAEAGLHPVVS